MASSVACFATGIGTPGAGVTCYPPIVGSARLRYANTTEVHAQMKYHTAGVFSSLIAVVKTNTTSAASTVDLRKGAVSQTSTLSIGAAATGTFEDTTHTDTIAVNDLVNLRIVNGTGGSLTIYQVGMIFTASSPRTVWKSGTGFASGDSGTSVTVFLPLCGNPDSTALGTGLSATEAATQVRMGDAYTASFFSLYCDTNARTTTTTLRTRKNSVDGQSITIGAAATGFFEDVTNSDTLVSGDLYNFSMVLGTGVGNLGLRGSSVEFSGFNTSCFWTNNWIIFGALAAASTTYIHPQGLFQLNSATEADVQLKTRMSVHVSASAVYVSANATAAGSTITWRTNAVDTTLTMSIGAAATGLFTNVANTELITSAGLVNWKVVVGTGGTLSLAALSVQASGDILLGGITF